MKLIQVKCNFSFAIFIDLNISIGFTLQPRLMSEKIVDLYLDKMEKSQRHDRFL